MFEKQRESLEASKNYQKAKLHVQTHKMAYACLGSAAVSGSVVTLLKSRPLEVTNITNVAPSIAPVFNNSNVGNKVVNNVGHCCKIVQDVATKKLWPTAKALAMELAEEHDISYDRARWLLSRHTNGAEGFETLFGKKYVNYATTTTG